MRGQRGSFLGFTFNDIHSSVFGITRTSDGSRFNHNLTPSRVNTTSDLPQQDGTIYHGQTYEKTEFVINYAFDQVTELQLQDMKMLWSDKKIHDLIFDEYPYKVYSAKITGNNQIKHIAFEQNGVRIYKGEGSLTFTCYFPFARSRYEYQEDYIISNIPEWLPDSQNERLLFSYLAKRHNTITAGQRIYYSQSFDLLFNQTYGQLHFDNSSTAGQEFEQLLRNENISIKDSDSSAKIHKDIYTPIIDYNRYSEYSNYDEWIEASEIPSRSGYGLWEENASEGWHCELYNAGDIAANLQLTFAAPLQETSVKIKLGENEELSIVFPKNDQVGFYTIDFYSNQIWAFDQNGNKIGINNNCEIIGSFFEIPTGEISLNVQGMQPQNHKITYYYI